MSKHPFPFRNID